MSNEPEYDSAEQDTLVGTALEKYEIQQKIGEGSIGTIYRGRDTSNDQAVAIKFLTREITSKPQILARFKREIQTAIKMRHPNIVRGYSAGVWEGCIYYYVMEFVDGPTLQDLFSQQKLTEKQVIKIAVQIASALQYIHEFGMIHRDLKPENIMLTGEGEAKLADLGLAKDMNDISGLTMVGTIIGTPLYMSPEQAKGAAVIDIRSDVYSLGATLFHALTGEPPFKGRTAPEVIAKQIEEIPPGVRELNPSISIGMEYVIRKMLEKDPEARYQAPRDLLEDLHLILEGKGDTQDVDLPWSQVPVQMDSEFRFAFYPGEEDFEYGLTAVANGMIEKPQMAGILDFQEEMARHSVPLKIAHIAVEKGIMRKEAHRKIKEAQSRAREQEAGTGFGKLAIKKGLASKEQVQEALKKQKALRKEGKFRLLGEILKKMGALDDEGVRNLVAGQNQLKFAKEDKKFLDLLKHRLLLTGPVADKVLLVQKNEIAMTRYRRIGEILVDRRFLSREAHDVAMRAIRRSQLTGEDLENLVDEKETTGEARETEEIRGDEKILKKYRAFIDKQLKAGKVLRSRRKFREAIDAWRAILEVLVLHPEAEKRILDAQNIIENMDAHESQARKYFHMAVREWESILKIDSAFPPALEAVTSARQRITRILSKAGLDPEGTTDKTQSRPPPPEGDLSATEATRPPQDSEPEMGAGGDEGPDDQKLKRLLRGAKRFEKQGNTKEARKRYLEILEIDPSNENAVASLKGMQKGILKTALLGCFTLFLALVVACGGAWFLLGPFTCQKLLFRALWALREFLK